MSIALDTDLLTPLYIDIFTNLLAIRQFLVWKDEIIKL